MNKLNFSILRNSLFTNKKPNFSKIHPRWYSKSENDKPKQTETKSKENKKNEKSQIVLNKLNNLLEKMVQDPVKSSSAATLNLAKPEPKREKRTPKISKTVDQKAKETVLNAVKEVAESLGGNTKQTESELMKKLLNNNEEEKSDSVSSLGEIFKGMKIDRSQPNMEQQSRSQQVKQILTRTLRQPKKRFVEPRVTPQNMRRPQVSTLDNINLFGSEPLGIFTADPSEYSEGLKNTTWETLSQREMKLAVTHPPSSYFQQMILWTEQGKLWKFPIDNEQGLEEEQNVYFADHVFLEKHLEPWCPPKGPIRHFMELVCVGLSKNPYLTADAKREHIEWYKNYFEDKRQLLKEVGASLNEIEQVKEIESK